MRQLWPVPINSLQQKLSLVLREVTLRSDGLSAKIDQVHWTLSEELDAYFAGIGAWQHEPVRNPEDDLALAEDPERWRAAVNGQLRELRESVSDVAGRKETKLGMNLDCTQRPLHLQGENTILPQARHPLLPSTV
jgi:hypothetical protein